MPSVAVAVPTAPITIFREKNQELCASAQNTVVDCCSLTCEAVAVLTGLITIFRKRNHELLASPQNTLGDCCFLPYVAMDGPNT